MAYMNQEKKKAVEPEVKAILRKYSLKGSLSVKYHSTLVLTVAEGSIDFLNNYKTTSTDKLDYRNLNINVYWYKEHFTGEALDFLNEVMTVLNRGNFDKSDIMTDHFHVGFYVDIFIGHYDRPYKYSNN